MSLTNRQVAVNVLTSNKAILASEGPKAFRQTCLTLIAEQTSAKDVGATFNDAKHILINAGTIEAFGRHGKGRNHNSASKLRGPGAEDKWQIVCKTTGQAVGWATSRAKAIALRPAVETHKVIKL